MKDNFSVQAAQYAQFRPGYPEALFTFLFEHCPAFGHAWDCATGNGQMALALAKRFEVVDATDISENQLKNATPAPNIRYRLGRAESTDFPDHSLHLITVGQAAHWFDFTLFYPEVKRVLAPGGMLALIGYNLLTVNEKVDAIVNHFYHNTLAGCWDAERRLVEEAYQTIPFPLDEILLPEMASEYRWQCPDLLGYLSTWSAVQHYTRRNGQSPINEALKEALTSAWPDGETKVVRFPIFGRVGKV